VIRFALLALVLVAASYRERGAEAYLRQGDDAARRGRWAEAARLYEKAEVWAADPGLVAFNLATARYHLAEGDPRELAAAEGGFRACLSGPRKGRAMLGLGNCLLLRAAGSPDAVTLRAAIDRFAEALTEPDVTTGDQAAARHNRERARLLLLQCRLRSDGPQDGGDEKPPEDNEPGTEPVPAKKKEGVEVQTDDKGQPKAGKGKMLPPVPVGKNAPKIGGAEAAAHLEEAADRILNEWRAYRRTKSRPAATGRDW
jgi:hypothetical protein